MILAILPTHIERITKSEQKIHIIGSCATRDSFRVLNKDSLVGRYTSRASLISRVWPPLSFDFSSYFDEVNLDWKQKMIVQDFAKSGLYLDDYAEGILIIDFLDEMFKLLKVGNTYVTKSNEFMRWELEQVLGVSETILRGRLQDFDLWTDACYKFTDLIPKSIREKTFLHKAFWSEKYLENGEVHSFENQAGINFFNKNLAYYYDTFQSIYSPANVLEIAPEKRIADPNHTWGLAPFHYVLEYYQEFDRQVSYLYTLQK